jgi:hypothetical protein
MYICLQIKCFESSRQSSLPSDGLAMADPVGPPQGHRILPKRDLQLGRNPP